MIVFELPSDRDRGGLRAVAIGSCRIRNPISVLARRGDLKLCVVGLEATHTTVEALQSLEFVVGAIDIPDRLSPYIFGVERTPPRDDLARAVKNGVDAFVVEISDDRHFSYRDICLQQNFLSINFVRPHGSALLGWFRRLCSGHPIDEACVQTALEQLKAGEFRHDEDMADLLRNIRQTWQSEEEITDQLNALTSGFSGLWAVVGAIDVPEYDGIIMQHRRALNKKLSRAAKRCNTVFYDPSKLIAEHGAATALDGGGADIYEYAPDFYPTVGRTMVSLLQTGRPVSSRAADALASQLSRSPRCAFQERSALADRVNRALLSLHRGRLATLGVEASGLGNHYKGHLERETLVGTRELGALELIAAYLPPYDAYAVMRAGLGELALLLAASGRKAIAFEPYPTRRAAIEAGRASLEASGLLAPSLLDVVASLTPEGALGGRVLGVGLDVAHVTTEGAAEPHYENLSRFEAILVSMPAFLRRRTNVEEQDVAASRLYGLGFSVRRDYSGDRLSWFHRKNTKT